MSEDKRSEAETEKVYDHTVKTLLNTPPIKKSSKQAQRKSAERKRYE
jgi:hypothetical protein